MNSLKINIFTVFDLVITFVWAFVGTPVQVLAVVIGGITAIGCGIGFIYYGIIIIIILIIKRFINIVVGKDLVVMLSQGGNNSAFGNLSKKVFSLFSNIPFLATDLFFFLFLFLFFLDCTFCGSLCGSSIHVLYYILCRLNGNRAEQIPDATSSCNHFYCNLFSFVYSQIYHFPSFFQK